MGLHVVLTRAPRSGGALRLLHPRREARAQRLGTSLPQLCGEFVAPLSSLPELPELRGLL